ncbi:MAG: hypothetical protein NVS2B6_17220 [Thermoleophilaceae bacterium]
MKLPEEPTLRELGDDEQERHLVLAGWLRTYVDQSHGVERSVFFRLYEPLVRELLERCTVLLACMPDCPSAVYGWAAFEGDVLHYVCCKPRWQRLGIASWLLKDFFGLPVTYTHRTRDGMRLPLPETWTYSPMQRFKEAA